MPKFILNCAVTGAIHTPTMAPFLPIRPEEIAAQAIDAASAGATTVHVQFVMGILGGIAATIPHLLHMKQTLDTLFGERALFSTIAAGKNEFAMGTTSVLLGGGARVGLEDNLWRSRGEMAESNAELVEKMVRIARELGYEPYTPDEAREVLKLKGRDKVAF